MKVYGSVLAIALTFFFHPDAYAGCISGDCWDGLGAYLYPSGAKYIGNFKDGKIHGKGVLYFKSGDVYDGEWVNFFRDGQGTLSFKNGDQYVGSFRKSKFQGIGTMNFRNGDRYTGNWLENLPNGSGKYFFESGERYEGSFLNGKFDGQGSMFYTDGGKFVGRWRDNQKHGRGVFYSPEGDKQSGEWANGELTDEQPVAANTAPTNSKPTGTAGLRNCNDIYCANGRGVFTYVDGSQYVGDFKNGEPEGQGELIYANGDRYVGGWAQHAPHGEGVMYFVNGRVYGGLWHYGKSVKELKPKEESKITLDDVAQEESSEVRIWAVVVGVGRYTHMPVLKYTDDDAYKMYAFLKSTEGGALPDEQVQVLVDDDATRENVLKSLRQMMGKADANDVVMFYFSGHGLEGAFLPVDYDGYRNRLFHSEIRQILEQSHARHKLVLADACHSGSLLAMKGSATAALKQFYDAFENSAGGLALLMSSKSEEYSLEDSGLRSGIFSHYLIRGLKGGADANRDKIITISELFNFVFAEVREYTAGVQTPTLTGKFDKDMPVAVRR